MNIFEEAADFAIRAHAGMIRKGDGSPYVLHPLEAASICATLTEDPEVIAAAALHDVVEDTAVTLEEVRERFGERVAYLVSCETENKRPQLPSAETWRIRKEESLAELENAEDPAVKILWLGDKLSNMRGFYRQWRVLGSALWQRFNQKDPAQQAWYYRRVAKLLEELSYSAAWQEYNSLVEKVFGGVEE